MKTKTRVAYVKLQNGKFQRLEDTVEEALKANMMVRDYEKQLIKLNPQLSIIFKIEEFIQ